MQRKLFVMFAAACAVVSFVRPAMGQSAAADAVTAVRGLRDDFRGLRDDFSGLKATVDKLGDRVDTLTERRKAMAASAPAPASTAATGSPVPSPPRAVSDSERDASALRAVTREVGEIKDDLESSALTASGASSRLGRLEDIARVYYCAGSPPSDATSLCANVAEAREMGKHRLNRMLHPSVYGTVAAVAPSEESIAYYSAMRCVLPAAVGAIGAGIMAITAPPNRAAQNEVWVGVAVGAVAGIASAVFSNSGGQALGNGLLSAACGFAGAGGVAVGDVAIRPDHRRDIRANVVVVR